MKETIKILSTLIFINFFIVGCVSLDSDTKNEPLTLECSLSTAYSPFSTPILSFAAEFNAPTVILLHGKNGSPTTTYMQDLASDLNFAGYNVIQPYMPWFSEQWNGTLCDSIAYLNELIFLEQANPNEVILIGHSLGGTVALAYSALFNTIKPDALGIFAPGHFIHQSGVLADAHKDSIIKAKEMTENNQSQEETIFQTYNNDTIVNITTTPEIYLSFHDVEEFPDIKSTTPLILTRLLWLAGTEDDLTTTAITFGIIDLIPYSNDNRYMELQGDHYTFLSSTSDVFDPWFKGL